MFCSFSIIKKEGILLLNELLAAMVMLTIYLEGGFMEVTKGAEFSEEG